MTGAPAAAVVDENAKARLRALRAALAVIAVVAVAALFFSGTVPTRQPGSDAAGVERAPPADEPTPATT